MKFDLRVAGRQRPTVLCHRAPIVSNRLLVSREKLSKAIRERLEVQGKKS